jgi:hypothetical protein
MLLGAPLAQAQDTTEAALQGQSCARDRLGQNLNCTANEYVVTATSESNTITSCNNGDPVVVDIIVGITSSSTDRYNVGYFVGETGNDPSAAGGSCSIATFPTTPTGVNTTGGQWFDAGGGNTCGDYNKNSTTSNLITGVKVKCAADSNGNLAIPFVVTYAQNSNDACTGPSDVAPGSPAKCTANVAPVTNVIVTYNADPGCNGKTVTYDPVAGTVTSTFTIQNNDPNNAIPPDNADGTTFEDIVPAPVTVTSVTCTPSSGTVSCDTTATVGNDVKGTISPFPTGTSVLVTIVGTVPGGNTGTYSNTATLTPPANLTAGSDATGNNLCSNSTTLPVQLQSFDVH